MIATLLNKLASNTSQYKALRNEVSEFKALKVEINKARCIVELNAEGQVLHANDNLCKVLGYTESELLGQHHRTLLSRAEATKPAYDTFWSGLRSGQAQVGTFKNVDKQGRDVWFQGYYAPVCDGPNNSLRKVVAYLTDVTKTQGSLQVLSADEAGINSIFAIATLALDTTIVDINDNFLKAVGYSRDELVGRHLGILLTKEDRENPEYVRYWDALRKGEAQSKQIRRVAKDGRILWFQATFFPVVDAEGKIIHVKNYCACITSEKNKNLDYEAQLTAIRQMQGVIEFDLQGNILFVNDMFAKVSGYPATELIGKHHSIFVDAAYKASAEYRQFWDDLRSGKNNDGEFKRFARNNKEIWLRGNYYPIKDVEGNVVKIVKFAFDITAEKTAQLRRDQEAAQAMMIQTTLDSASTNMMMADNDGMIRYMNRSTEKLMRDSESNFKKVLPQFDATKIVGQNFDIFHKNPAHQRNLLAGLTKEYSVELPLGDLFMRLKATPIFDKSGNRAGTSLEWQDITQERRTSEQIAEIIAHAANGDLSSRIDVTDKTGTTVDICTGINNLLDNITELLVHVREAGETINTAAQEIATGNNDLSSRTEQQASSLEETASSMEELASTVKQNADNARQANQMAEAASQVAVRGGEVVGNVVTTMSAINESARKIEDIITVIDGIAFQTNILALNAAVEAARAGEQGRGFAVVAGEVRNLAQRSASAAKEIKELISDSVSKTAEGTKLVESAGATMHEIVTSVQRVTDIMSEITAASAEQSSGIDQVNGAITNMDEVTQQNAALVEEAAAAAESLVEQAGNLMDSVNRYKLRGMAGESRGMTRSAPARQAAPAARPSAPVAKPKPVSAPAASYHKPAKTGTDDTDWEEF